MKRILFTLLALGMVLNAPMNTNAKQHINRVRKATGRVIDYSPKDSVAYIKTSDGNVWMISEADFEIGDLVSVKFDTRRTKKKQDDRILRVRYIGYESTL